MTTEELFASFSHALACDEEVLSRAERELLANILQRALIHQEESASSRDVIVRAIGEALGQRFGSRVGEKIRQEILSSLPAANNSRGLSREWQLPRPTPAGFELGNFETMGTPSVPPPAPDTRAPRPPSPGPPSPQITSENRALDSDSSRFLEASMGTPSVPPPAPDRPGPRPPAPGPPSPGILGRGQSKGPRPPVPGPPSPAVPIAPKGPLPPSVGPRPKWNVEPGWQQIAVSHMPRIMPAACVVLDEFLAPSEAEAMLQYALECEERFVVSEVISPGVSAGHVDYEHRRSRILYDLGAPGSLVVERLQECLPRILPKLDRELFPIARIEAQITASNDGDFFRWHCDDGQGEVARRESTFVYFFHREPKEFRGGELRLYESMRATGGYIPASEYRSIVPQQNQLVIFPSALAHEITPVECATRAFGSSRFTLNGWFHR